MPLVSFPRRLESREVHELDARLREHEKLHHLREALAAMAANMTDKVFSKGDRT